MRYEDLRAGSVLAIGNRQLCGWFAHDDTITNTKIPRFVIGSCDFGAYEGRGKRYDCGTPLFYVGNATVAASGSVGRQVRLIYADEQLGYVEFNDIDKLQEVTSEHQG
jgi:hypothetical protein